MVELTLPIPGSTLDIPIKLDVVDVEIPTLLRVDVLDGNKILVDNVTNNRRNRIITNKDQLRYEEEWNIKLIRKGDHLYVPLYTRFQLIYTMTQLRKHHMQFAHSSATKLCVLPKKARTKAENPKDN